MNKSILTIVSLIIVFPLFAQKYTGFSMDIGAGINMPYNEDRAASMSFSIEPKYKLKNIGFGFRYEQGILGFGIDEAHNLLLEPEPFNYTFYPVVIRRSSSKESSTIQLTLDLLPTGFEKKIGISFGLGYFHRKKIRRYELDNSINLDLGSETRLGGSLSLYYRWNKFNFFSRMNSIYKTNPDSYVRFNNYWSTGISYNFNFRNNDNIDSGIDFENKNSLFRFEIGPQINIPIDDISSALSLNIYASVTYYWKEKISISFIHSRYPKRQGLDEENIGYGSISIGPISTIYTNKGSIMSKISSSQLIASLIRFKKNNGYFSFGTGVSYFESRSININSELFNPILSEKSIFGAVVNLELNTNIISHHLTFNTPAKDLPFYISYRIGLGINLKKKNSK